MAAISCNSQNLGQALIHRHSTQEEGNSRAPWKFSRHVAASLVISLGLACICTVRFSVGAWEGSGTHKDQDKDSSQAAAFVQTDDQQAEALLQKASSNVEPRWQLASPGQSCTDKCTSLGESCLEDELWNVDNSQAIRAAAQEAHHPCTDVAGWAYDNAPGICTAPSCCGGSCVGMCAYGNTQTRTCAGKMGGYSRLCPCGTERETTTTTTTVPPRPKPPGFERSLFLLPDKVNLMLMLAVVPASSKTAKEPAILVMPGASDDTSAFQDFVEQYRPQTTYVFGSPPLGIFAGKLGNEVPLSASSPCQTSVDITNKFWSKASELVVVKCDDYEAALMAAPLAAHRSMPLVLVDDSVDLAYLVRKLGVKNIVHVGAGQIPSLQGVPTSILRTASEVFDAFSRTPDYLAIANPFDKDNSMYQGLSAVAAMLAALRRGVVLPLVGGSDLSASSAQAQLKAHVAEKGMPKYLAIVGGPNAIPPHCAFHSNSEKCRDAPYANLDADVFLDVAVGRLVARNLASASLLVSRIANYDYVRDPVSEGRFAMSGLLKSSMDSIRPALTNVGFAEPQMLSQSDISKLQAKSTKLQVSAFLHTDHSWAQGLGHSFTANSRVLFSPVVISSGGCSTAGFDKLPDVKQSVVLTLLHYGAVAFLGGPRNAITASGLVHSAFWNAIAKGKSIGEAFEDGWNDIALNNEERADSSAQYVMMNIALYGDPAFKLFIPSELNECGAAVTMLDDNKVMAKGPETWTKYKADQSLADEWKWGGKLYYYGAPGSIDQKRWAGKYDAEYPYLFARLKTYGHATRLQALTSVPFPLGWTGRAGGPGAPGGKLHVDEHSDGTRTLMWRIRLLDYDFVTGVIKNQFSNQTYKIVWDTPPPPIALGYKLERKSCVNGHNIKRYQSKTVKGCAELCNNEPRCIAFEYGVQYGGRGSYKPGDCVLNDSSDSQGCPGSYQNLDLYVKVQQRCPLLAQK